MNSANKLKLKNTNGYIFFIIVNVLIFQQSFIRCMELFKNPFLYDKTFFDDTMISGMKKKDAKTSLFSYKSLSENENGNLELSQNKDDNLDPNQPSLYENTSNSKFDYGISIIF